VESTPGEPAEPDGIDDGVVRPLDPRYVPLQRKVGWITVAVFAVICLVGLVVAFLADSGWLWFGLAAAASVAILTSLGWFAHAWPPIEYRHVSYRVDGDGLEIRRGVFWRQVVNVPRSRVQHTDVTQGPLERSHGLATLVVHTAGVEHAQVDLSGLPYETALRVRDHLLPRDASDAV
jgi:membrane protein YdbS with pleckstrin-like domain